MDVPIKLEMEPDSDGNVPLSMGSEQESRALKTEPAEEHIWEVTRTRVGDIKCEFESDPEYDEELRRASLQQHRVKTAPAERDIEKDGAAQRAEPEKQRQAADTASVQQTHQSREDATTPPGDSRYQCTVCHKCFSGATALRRHIRRHTGEKPYVCDICQRRFARTFTLRQHTMTHTGEKPYGCDKCQYRCSKKSNLLLHVRTHTGEKPFKCNVCQRWFSLKFNLQAHLKTHTNEKPSEDSILKSHLIYKHAGEKLHKCKTCNKLFISKSYLKAHMAIHNSENHFECDICQRQYTRKCHLRAHIMSHTSEKQSTV